MRKLFYLILSFLFLGLASCGPSAKQKAAEQARLDSIAAAEEQRILDSIAEAEAIAAAEAAAAAAQQQVAPPPKPQGTTRTRGSQAEEADQSDVSRVRRAPEESVREVIDSTTTRRRKSG